MQAPKKISCNDGPSQAPRICAFEAAQRGLCIAETERDHPALDGRDHRRERSAAESVQNRLGFRTKSRACMRVTENRGTFPSIRTAS